MINFDKFVAKAPVLRAEDLIADVMVEKCDKLARQGELVTHFENWRLELLNGLSDFASIGADDEEIKQLAWHYMSDAFFSPFISWVTPTEAGYQKAISVEVCFLDVNKQWQVQQTVLNIAT